MEGDELGKNFFLYELGTWEGRYTTVACVKKLKAFDVLVRCFFFSTSYKKDVVVHVHLFVFVKTVCPSVCPHN
jgi:hypothetical protein